MVKQFIDSGLTDEQWRLIVDHQHYEVSSLGRVRRCRPGRASPAGRLMTACNHPMGYKLVVLRTGDAKKRRTLLVHRLVAMAFLPQQPGCPNINHKNFDRTDNRVENLEWCTQLQNVQHSEDGKRRTPAVMKGALNSNTSLTDDDIRTIRILRESGIGRLELSRRYGIKPEQVWKIATRRQWQHVD